MMSISFQKLFFAIATVMGLFAILVLARPILIPIGFALLMSFILFPMAKKFELWGMNRIIAALLSIISVLSLLAGIIVFFLIQIGGSSEGFTRFQTKIIQIFADLTEYANDNLDFIPFLNKNELYDQIASRLAESSGSLVRQSFSSTTTFLTGFLATIIFTFLFLIYREALTKAFIRFSPTSNRDKVFKMLKSVQEVGQQYLSGMIIIIIVIGFANSIGLWIIGIDNPFLFGFLGALLSVIPYIGTTLGGIIPVMYAIVTHDSLPMAFTIAILFWFVQLTSDNILSPKIVGGSLKINALAAILSLIIGASVWGIAGMILFLPFTAMLKVVCDEYKELKPIALLIEDQNHNKKNDPFRFLKKPLKKIKSWSSTIFSSKNEKGK